MLKILKTPSKAAANSNGQPMVKLTVGGQDIYLTGFESEVEAQSAVVEILTPDGHKCGSVSLKHLDRIGKVDEAPAREHNYKGYAFESNRQRAEHLLIFIDLMQAKERETDAYFQAELAEQIAAARTCPYQLEIVGPWGFDFVVGAEDPLAVETIMRQFLRRNDETQEFRTIRNGKCVRTVPIARNQRAATEAADMDCRQ